MYHFFRQCVIVQHRIGIPEQSRIMSDINTVKILLSSIEIEYLMSLKRFIYLQNQSFYVYNFTITKIRQLR